MGRASPALPGAQAAEHSSPLLHEHAHPGHHAPSPRALAAASPGGGSLSGGSFSARLRECGALVNCRQRVPPLEGAATRSLADLAPPPSSPAAHFPRNVSICQLAGGASEEESIQHKRVRAGRARRAGRAPAVERREERPCMCPLPTGSSLLRASPPTPQIQRKLIGALCLAFVFMIIEVSLEPWALS